MASEPMSDARLAEIRKISDRFNSGEAGKYIGTGATTVRDSSRLGHAMPLVLAEVERLRAREAALMEIAQAVADAGAQFNYGHDTTLLILCPGDDAESIRDKARALLAATEPTEATTAE